LGKAADIMEIKFKGKRNWVIEGKLTHRESYDDDKKWREALRN
jgi:hypothetical protein